MALNSLYYFIFFLVVFCINYFLKPHFRKYFLIISSFVFISFNNLESLFILLFSILSTFYLAKKIENYKTQETKKIYFRLSIFLSLSILFLFKYFDTKSGSFSFLSANFKAENIIYSLGISFYTLQNISYLFDIYYKRIPLEKSIVNFTLFASYFPKFLMGPITNPSDFIPQIDKTSIQKSSVVIGAQRILLGLVKKIVIADRLSVYVHFNFDINDPFTGLTSLVAVYLFTIQLYFDFTGYMDIALGSSKMLGFDLKENFNFPLKAISITDFWRKWYISLTSWLTDRVYYPLSFKYRKHKRLGISFALFTTFMLSGIWHGISVTFILYALCHAIYMIIELYTLSFREKIAKALPVKLHHYLSVIITFNLVSFSFIFFRSTSLEKSIQFFNSIFDLKNFLPSNWYLDFFSKIATGGDQKHFFNLAITLLISSAFILFEKTIFKKTVSERLNSKSIILFILLLALFGSYTVQEQFIYNQF